MRSLGTSVRYLSCSNALRAAKKVKTGARARSVRMRPCDRLPHAVTMPAYLRRRRQFTTASRHTSACHVSADSTPAGAAQASQVVNTPRCVSCRLSQRASRRVVRTPLRPGGVSARLQACQHPSASHTRVCKRALGPGPVTDPVTDTLISYTISRWKGIPGIAPSALPKSLLRRPRKDKPSW